MSVVLTSSRTSERERKYYGRAVVFAEYFPPYMGSDRRILDLVRHAPEWAFEFAVVPPLRILGGRCEEALEAYFQRHFVEGIVEDESFGIHGHYFTLPRALMKLWKSAPMHIAYAATVPYIIAQGVAYLKARRPDVVIVAHPSYLCGLAGLAAARIAGIPSVLDYPDAWTPLAVETASLDAHGVTARILRSLETGIARAATHIVSITRGLEHYVRSLGAKCPVSIVSNGADAEFFDPDRVADMRMELGYSDADEVVLYSGRLETWSGVHEIVEAIRSVCAARPAARFLFVGDGTSARELTAEIGANNLSDRVRFLGFQRHGRMPGIVKAADVAIVPFPRTPTTEVCSPVKLFEYLAMRKAVITTDLPGVREAVDERHVTFVKDLSAAELGTAVLKLLNDPEKRRLLGEAGYEQCMRHQTWKVLGRQLSGVLMACTPAK